jgi:gamma-glutamyl-gamma-aminobutyrate hydrolase PuuD
MIAAITQRLIKNPNGQWADCLELNYSKLFTNLGFTVIPVPNSPGAVEACIRNFKPDHIVLSGGEDIIVNFETNNPPPEQLRENTEKSLLDYAVKEKVPVLGICRGAQFINIYFGGKLCEDIHSVVENHQPGTRHPLTLTESPLPAMLGKIDCIECNSYHNQGILDEGLGKDLKTFASAGPLVEGLFHLNLPVAGVQWHPERETKSSGLDQIIISSFLKKELFWRSK